MLFLSVSGEVSWSARSKVTIWTVEFVRVFVKLFIMPLEIIPSSDDCLAYFARITALTRFEMRLPA